MGRSAIGCCVGETRSKLANFWLNLCQNATPVAARILKTSQGTAMILTMYILEELLIWLILKLNEYGLA